MPNVNEVLASCDTCNLPSREWGSDHLLMCCDIVLRTTDT
jgi:hypothetical protein